MAEETSTSNSRIAKNTILLYMRMLITMGVALYTSRVVLATLGVEDFGIYNVVGGVVTMFSLLSGSLMAAISRFITFELGTGNEEKLHRVFCTSVSVQLIMSAIVLVVAETVGLWILNTQLNIPDGRMGAANWVYQCSIVTFILGLISAPYNAAVISHERMSVFAKVSIGEALAKLGLVIALQYVWTDKLITYAIFLAAVALAVRIIYGVYCSRNFKECHYEPKLDKQLLKEMSSFAGWSMWGNGSYLLMNQGVNLLVNVYFGVVFNAARGIAGQVESAVGQFTSSFTTALNPQITKDFAKGDMANMFTLVFSGSKFSFFLMSIASLPILLETDFILNLWLKNPPDYAVMFVRLTIAISMLHVISNTLVTTMLATGKIRNYQLIVGGMGMLIFPVVWVLYEFGAPVYICYIVHFLVFVAQLVARLVMLKRMVGLDVRGFVREVLLQDVKVMIIASVIPVALKLSLAECAASSLTVLVVSIASACGAAYLFGLKETERVAAKAMVGKFIGKIKKQ